MKNRVIYLITVCFSLFFIFFIIQTTTELSKSNPNILKSSNVINANDLVETRVYVSQNDMAGDDWKRKTYDDSNWQKIKIPSFQAVQLKEFKPDNFIYYRIKIPKSSFDKINHLKNETFIVLQSIYLGSFDVFINGNLYRSYRPINAGETRTILPVIESQDNLIAIKGKIHKGDTGIDSRDPIMLGKGVEFNEVHRASYKAQTVFQLVFILCKGSILFIFALIYLLLKVDRSFEKFFVFGICALVEELIAGDYLYGPLNFNQMVYLYNFVNIIGAIALILFFAELVSYRIKFKTLIALGTVLSLVSYSLAADSLHANYFVNVSGFMKFWNVVIITLLSCFIGRLWSVDKILLAGTLATIALYLGGALSLNIGLNLKAYGNLLLFSIVAYQTFALFRREQTELQDKEKELLEKEKEIAIAKTASLLAHDVRKPLEQIKLVIERVFARNASEEFLKIAKEDIDSSISSVDQMVHDIMNFSRSSEISLAEMSFYRSLSHALKQVMSLHEEMRIKLVYKFEANTKILGDQKGLSNLLINLISNAVEAIRDLGGRYEGMIAFETCVIEGKFCFKVFNDGPEIPSEKLDEIFKPLYTYGKSGGTGLGLASVLKTINDHKGSIRVRNINGGVQFILEFISCKEEDLFEKYDFRAHSTDYSYKPLAENTNNIGLGLRVLLLEPISNIKDVLLKELDKLPFKCQVDCADNVIHFDEAIEKKRYDLYLINSEFADCRERKLRYLSHEVIIYSSKDMRLDLIHVVCKKVFTSRPKILFVDDTKLFRIAWEGFHGAHNILCLSSPEEALSHLKSTSEVYDVIVLDFYFSNSSMNGLALAKKIIEMRRECKVLIASNAEENVEGFKLISKRDYDVRRFILNY